MFKWFLKQSLVMLIGVCFGATVGSLTVIGFQMKSEGVMETIKEYNQTLCGDLE